MAASISRRPAPAPEPVKRVKAAPSKAAPIQLVQAATISLGRVVALGTDVEVELGGRSVAALVDASVDVSVIKTAFERGERVLIEVIGDRAVIVGALRTQATPGIERGEKFVIEAGEVAIAAKRVTIDGDEIALSSKTARLVLRAAGEIESFAERIVSRASGVHKIVGRMLRLN